MEQSKTTHSFKKYFLGPLIGFPICFLLFVLFTENDAIKSLSVAAFASGGMLLGNAIGYTWERKKKYSEAKAQVCDATNVE